MQVLAQRCCHGMLDGRFYSVRCKTGTEAFPKACCTATPLMRLAFQMRHACSCGYTQYRVLAVSAVFPVFPVWVIAPNRTRRSAADENHYRKNESNTHRLHTCTPATESCSIALGQHRQCRSVNRCAYVGPADRPPWMKSQAVLRAWRGSDQERLVDASAAKEVSASHAHDAPDRP